MAAKSVKSVWAAGLLGCGLASVSLTAFATAQNVAVGIQNTGAERTARVTVDVRNAELEGVLRSISRQAGLSLYFPAKKIPTSSRVTMRVRDALPADAFARALEGTGLKVTMTPSLAIVSDDEGRVAGGIITGTVIDAKTRQPIARATIILDKANKGVMTAEDGTFRVGGVSEGTHTVTARAIGHARQVVTVTVTDGETTKTSFTLDTQATPLDNVVVTGTVIPTELKAVPSAITVITAKEIEQRGITHIDQLFRGDVPGVFAENKGSSSHFGDVTMFSRGATNLSQYESIASTNPIKTYVDGVEIADSRYLSQIDPRSIERIEILTGPQASTIYGSNAINGVMQIFTKRGATNRPQLTLNLFSGFIQSNYNNSLTPEHDYSAQLNDVEGRVSYNAGATWTHTGGWSPATRPTVLSAYGGARLEFATPVGRLSADGSFRRTKSQDSQRGEDLDVVTYYRQTGFFKPCSDCNSGLVPPTSWLLNGQTLGVTFNYAPTSWWSHELGLGQDMDQSTVTYTAPAYKTVNDSSLSYGFGENTRQSLRYTTTATISMSAFSKMSVTLGTDARSELSTSVGLQPQSLSGSLRSPYYSIQRQPGHNTGAFVQAQLGVIDQLFFTYGMRAEWNPTYGKSAEPNYAPRYGIAYTQEAGPVTAKVRASYGRSTRPPAVSLKQGRAETEAEFIRIYGPHLSRLANPDLAPEFQQGGEVGMELYLGQMLSVVATHYNQTVDNLITTVPKGDSVKSLMTNPSFYGLTCADWAGISYYTACSSQDAQGYAYAAQSQNANVGSIRNQGWEFQSTLSTGPLSTKLTYSWTKSRMLGITPKYAIQFPFDRYPQYQRGATFTYLPEHTMALGFTYALSRTTVALNLSQTGRARNFESTFYLANLDGNIRLPGNIASNVAWPFINFNDPYILADLNASHRFTNAVEGVLQIQNVANHYVNDFFGANAVMGRQTKGGLRIRF